ncbi:MAG TPA: hypothetical protein V6C86_22850 [Oculatellaceae cyanobacterium]
MDSTAPATAKRRPVRDFSRRNFVIFFVILLMVPATYLLWYLTGTASGSIVPSPDLKIGSLVPSSGGQFDFYTHILSVLWKANFSLVPYAVGQYLLGTPSDVDKNFVWGSASLLCLAILTAVQIFDVWLNQELGSLGKIVWSVLMAAGSAFGLPVPQLIYWFQFMWLEPDKGTGREAAAPAASAGA